MAGHGELDGLHARLALGFPGLPSDVIASVLSDSYRLVADTAGSPQLAKVEELATLRLEMRARHPRLSASQPDKAEPRRDSTSGG